MYSATNTMIASGHLINGACGMLADGTEQVVEHQTPQTYLQCSPSQSSDGLGYSSDLCPICIQPCSYDGAHKRVCLNNCGHVFCESCIKRWFHHQKAKAKCPTCNNKFKWRDVIKLYASPVPSDDQVNAQTRVKELEAENAYLRTEKASLVQIGQLSEIIYNEQQELINELKARCMRQQV